MVNKKCKNFSVAEKAEIIKFDEFHRIKVVFAQLQEIPMTTLQSILQKKKCIEKNIEKMGKNNAKKQRTMNKIVV